MTASHWTKIQIQALFESSFFDLIAQAYAHHIKHFDKHELELCTLLSIKTGACPEDCAYCPQSGHYKTDIKAQKLLDLSEVLPHAKAAKANGAKRFCMGAAWRSPPAKDFPKVLTLIKEVKALGLETCVTLGMLEEHEVLALKDAGLDYYNHNLDTSPNYYSKIITTRCYQDRLDTIEKVGNAGIKVCCGGILGMGESRDDIIELLLALNHLPKPPASIPINQLIAVPKTPLEAQEKIDAFEFIKTIAVIRIMFPKSKIRLSAGRDKMSEEMQAWCFMAGANSIYIGETLLTEKNAEPKRDVKLLEKLGFKLPEALKMKYHAD